MWNVYRSAEPHTGFEPRVLVLMGLVEQTLFQAKVASLTRLLVSSFRASASRVSNLSNS